MAQKQKAPLLTVDLRALAAASPSNLLGTRDRALLSIGFAGAFRRSELVTLTIADLAFVAEGLEVTVRQSKTDQTGRGMLKVISYGSDPSTCPVRSLRAWLDAGAIAEGLVFRSVDRHGKPGNALTDRSVARIIKTAAERAGLDASNLSGHSLRAGFVTEAKKNGASDAAVMDQTGHQSLEMVRRYTRRQRAWDRPASAQLGL